MLKHLTIRNYALIESLETDFYDGFSVITGETGAGKSIILGALSLILGQRADLQSLKNKSEKCVVEGLFSSIGNNDFFDENNLDFDAENTIIRREILPSGKSRAFINDTPVGLSVLKELAGKLVDLHSQNSSTLLQSASFQLSVLDSFCDNQAFLVKYRDLFVEFRSKKAMLEKLKEQEQHALAEQDYLTFQYEELESARLVDGEKDEMEQELEVLNHAEEIKTRLASTINLFESEHGLNELFSNLLAEIRSVKNFSNALEELFNRLESTYLEVTDISDEVTKIDDQIDVNPQRADELNDRVALLYRLEQKHRVSGTKELLRVKEEYREKLNRFGSLSDEILHVTKLCDDLEKQLRKLAAELSNRRKGAKDKLEKKIFEIVSLLGMPDATIQLQINNTENLTETGTDQVNFMFSANKGMELQEMSKIASGGELSRLMLAIKSQTASNSLISTIIFDEIDSGVSGEIAGKMAGIMRQLSGKIQVLSITHLPQIAARGQFHYLVLKESHDQSTLTTIKKLDEQNRITEIAKMLSDSRVSDSALQTARELMKN